MEASQSLLLNEESLLKIAEAKRPIFILEWLMFMEKYLTTAEKTKLKENQKKLVEQLLHQVNNFPGPPARRLIAKNLATLFNVGDTFLLFESVNQCNDILKNKDDSPSFLPTKLAAITCIGVMYGKLGRLMGRSYEETVNLLLKSLKNAESQARFEIYVTLGKIADGMGQAASSSHRDIFKAIKHGMIDRVMAVRSASAFCLSSMIKHAPFLYTTELETVFSLCFRSFEGSNYEARCSVAHVLAFLCASTQTSSLPVTSSKPVRLATIEDVLNLFSCGFLRGGFGFLKSSSVGSSNVSREVRVGVTHAYSLIVKYLGTIWLEKNLSLFITHLLDLLTSSKATTTQTEAINSRRCVNFVLDSSIGKLLGEKTQGQSIKCLVSIINRFNHNALSTNEAGNSAPQTTSTVTSSVTSEVSQHVLIAALTQISSLVDRLGTTSTILLNDSPGILDAIVSLVSHSVPSVRTHAAWCLRCVSIASPFHLTPLIERCLERLETMKASPESLSGYSAALAALLGSSSLTPLGIPHNKGKLIFSIAEDMLRSSVQNSRLALHRIQSGWLLIGSVMTLGPSVIRGLLPRLLLLWKSSFPRNSQDLESEKSRGDAFTWQVTLENRAGALAAMASLLTHSKMVVSDDVLKKLLHPLEHALNMLVLLLDSLPFKNVPAVRSSTDAVKLRLFDTLKLLPAELYESLYAKILKLIVAEFTLNTESTAIITTTLLKKLCYDDDDHLFGSWIQQTHHYAIEDQLQQNSAGTGALEHDTTRLYQLPPRLSDVRYDHQESGPLPQSLALVDSSCSLFAHLFPHVSNKHKVTMMSHFTECIKQAKSSTKESIQINILCALLGSLKNCTELKANLGSSDVRSSIQPLIMSLVIHSNPQVRAAACQSVGRLAQVVGEGKLVNELASACIERLKSSRETPLKSGYALALGCIHRHVASLGSPQNLNGTIGQLLTLSQDHVSPVVQVWSLHSLYLIADSGGPMFRSYVDPALEQSLRLLMNTPPFHSDVVQSIGKLVAAVIIAVGPELQSETDSVKATRRSLLMICDIMSTCQDPFVKSKAIECFQQLHMFAPKYTDVSTLVPLLCEVVDSPHLFLKRSATSCLHQLAQLDSREVCDCVSFWAETSNKGSSSEEDSLKWDRGLAAILFALIDLEPDPIFTNNAHKIVTSCVQYLAPEHLSSWISLCRETLTSSESNSNPSSPDDEIVESNYDLVDDDVTFKFPESTKSINAVIHPRWTTKVFAIETLSRVITACESSPLQKYHFDLAAAREKKTSSKKLTLDGKHSESFLVLHLADLIRMAFMAATAEADPLRLQGLKTLQLIIDKFSKVPEPEFPNHVLLEQFQAQVGAALRPAFSSDTPSHVTAVACEVCSKWIGSGVARDLNDLRRVNQLLVSSLSKLQKDSSSRQYNESASTIEKLSILKAWAEVYVVAMKEEEERQRLKMSKKSEEDDDEEIYDPQESLLQLVKPELRDLSNYWLAALKDHALLTLPPDYSHQIPHDGGVFYTSDIMDVVKPLYRSSWPQILHAAALWLCSTEFQRVQDADEGSPTNPAPGEKLSSQATIIKDFHLLFGICMEALCNPKSTDPMSNVIVCLESMETLFSHPLPRSFLAQDVELTIELSAVLHRLILTRDNPSCQLLVLNIAKRVLEARSEIIQEGRNGGKVLSSASNKPDGDEESKSRISTVGERGDDCEIQAGKSVVYPLLELCLCVLVRQFPELSPTSFTSSHPSNHQRTSTYFNADSVTLICTSLDILSLLPSICSAKGSLRILPSLLYLTTGVLKESSACQGQQEKEKIDSSILSCLFKLISCNLNDVNDEEIQMKWIDYLQSTFAGIIDMVKSSSHEGDEDIVKLDGVVVLKIIEVFITKSPMRAIQAPNLQFPCINLLRQLLQSTEHNVQIQCLVTLYKVFNYDNKVVSHCYIQALGPRVVELLITKTSKIDKEIDQMTYDLVTVGISTLESLIPKAEPEKRVDILNLLITILMNLLIVNQARGLRLQLHNFGLEKILKIAPTFASDFRSIMTQSPHFKSKLECAIKNQKNSHLTKFSTDRNKSESDKRPVDLPPVIKLKTDFSNFK